MLYSLGLWSSVCVSSSVHALTHSTSVYRGPRPSSIWDFFSGVQPMVNCQIQQYSHPSKQLRNSRQGTPQHWKSKIAKSRRGFETWRGSGKKNETVGVMVSTPKIDMLSGRNRFQSANLKSHITLSRCESVRLFFFISAPVLPLPHTQTPPPRGAHLQAACFLWDVKE